MSSPYLNVFQVERDGVNDHCELTREYALRQALGGTDIIVMPDTNVIANVRTFLQRGHGFRALGLHHLQKLLSEIRPLQVISGPALRELPEGFRAECEELFDHFLEKYCGFLAVPKARAPQSKGSFASMPLHERSVSALDANLVLHYYYVTKIHEVATRPSIGGDLDRFKVFVDEVVDEIDLLSSFDVELARYCFFDRNSKSLHGKGMKTSTARSLKQIQLNFLGPEKGFKSFIERVKVIDNASWDLSFLQYARRISSPNLDGRRRNVWIATFDAKLWEFSRTICEQTLPGLMAKRPELHAFPEVAKHVDRMVVELEVPSGLEGFEYWQKTMVHLMSIHAGRMTKALEPPIDDLVEVMEAKAKLNIAQMKERAQG